jgi:hypothetical protein
MTDPLDEIEAAFTVGAVVALRRRAARQRARAADWTVTGEAGVVIKSGEGVIADRIGDVLEGLAGEFEGELGGCPASV